MRNTMFKNDIVDIIVSDQCGDNGKMAEKLHKLNVFVNVYYKHTKIRANKKESLLEKAMDVRDIILGCSDFKDVYVNKYDMFFFYNMDIVTHMIFAGLVKKNSSLKCVLFEEGVLSYNNNEHYDRKMNFACKLRGLLGKANLKDRIEEFYCVIPEAYEGPRRTVRIPQIDLDNDMTGKQFTSLFSVSLAVDSYRPRYIYFASVYDFEGGEPIGEIDLIKEIANAVGKENLLVKVHPRDNVQRFLDAGIMVDKNSSVPWEAIQFSEDFSKHVFLTATSGSVLSVNLIITNMPHTYFLYPLCDISHNTSAQTSVKNIENLVTILQQTSDKSGMIHITSDLKEIL